MMKRFLSLLTSLMLLLGSLPVTAWADTYTYPEITITIPPSDMAQLELEFRAWAAELVADYYYGTYHASIDAAGLTYPQPYGEYFRMATTKYNFDASRTEKDKIVYNMYREGILEDQKRDSMTMWALKETLKDAMTIDSDNIIADYKEFKKKNPNQLKYVMLDSSTGTLIYNQALDAVDDVESTLVGTASTNALTDIILLGAEQCLQLQVQKSGGRNAASLSELVDGLGDTIDDVVEQWSEIAKINAEITAQNTMRDMLITDMANQIAYMNDRSAMLIRETYSGSLALQRNGNDALDTFIDMLDPQKNPALNRKTVNRAQMAVELQTFYNSIDLVEMQNIDIEVALTLGAIEAMKGVLKTSLDALVAQMKESKKTKKFKIGSLEADMSDVVGLLGDTLTETVDEAFEKTLSDIYDEYYSGSTGIDAAYCIDKLKENIVGRFTSEQIWMDLGANLIEAFGGIVADNIDTGNQWLNALFNTAVSVATDSESVAVDQAVKALLGIDREPTAKDILDYISNALDLAGDSYQKQYQQTLDAYSRRKNSLANTMRGYELKSTESRKKTANKAQSDVNKLKSKLDRQTLEIYCTLLDDIFETIVSGAEFWDSVTASMYEEGSMSLLAGCIASSRALSLPLTTNAFMTIHDRIPGSQTSREALVSSIQNPSLVSMDTLIQLVSVIHTKVKYDISGTLFYYDLAFHTWVMGDYFTGIKSDDRVAFYGGWIFAAEFFNYTQDHHTNMYLERGIVSDKVAAHLYNQVVTFYDTHFQDTYDPAWDVFFEEANGT